MHRRLAALTLSALLLPVAGAHALESRPDGQLEVWNSNVENLRWSGCGKADPKPLVDLMVAGTHLPDVVTVQQVDGASAKRTQLRRLVAEMNRRLPGARYASVVADPSPDKAMGRVQPRNSKACRAAKKYQTNAIVYRADRLTPIGSPRVEQTLKAGCTRNDQDRSKTISQTFGDNGRVLTATSFHWPRKTDKQKGAACAKANATRTAKLSDAGGATLNILGGDANVGTGHSSGWDENLGNRNFTNAVEGAGPIDFLFARKGPKVKGVVTEGRRIGIPGHEKTHPAVRGVVDF